MNSSHFLERIGETDRGQPVERLGASVPSPGRTAWKPLAAIKRLDPFLRGQPNNCPSSRIYTLDHTPRESAGFPTEVKDSVPWHSSVLWFLGSSVPWFFGSLVLGFFGSLWKALPLPSAAFGFPRSAFETTRANQFALAMLNSWGILTAGPINFFCAHPTHELRPKTFCRLHLRGSGPLCESSAHPLILNSLAKNTATLALANSGQHRTTDTANYPL